MWLLSAREQQRAPVLPSQCKRPVYCWRAAKGGVSDATPLRATVAANQYGGGHGNQRADAGLGAGSCRVRESSRIAATRAVGSVAKCARPRACAASAGERPECSGHLSVLGRWEARLRRPDPKLRDRLRQHCIPSSSDLSASFAWNLAKREASRAGLDTARRRAALMADATFAVHFVEAKAAVGLMPVQFTVEEHADLRTVFEVYATYALGTQEFNSFETH